MATTEIATGQTGAVIDEVAALPLGDLPADAATVARQCMLDWLGCTLAGSREPLAEILATELAAGDGGEGGDGGEDRERGESTIVGRRGRVAALTAAVVNGAASHALDYDDTHLAMSGHPTVPVAPAVLALGERLGATGAEVLAAFVAGVETECRVGMLVNPGHYAAGWHATATLGTFGAAAAAAHLLGLDRGRRLHALGIAGTEAAGVKGVFGTMCKPLHAGRAAQAGLLAAMLAARGFTSSTEILEAHQGFGATHTNEVAPAGDLERVRGRLLVRDTLFKHHAACYLTHAAIEGAAELVRNHGLGGAREVAEVRVVVHPSCMDVCAISEPATGLEGKFSLRATVAMALLGDDTADPEAYTDERMRSPELVAVRDRVTVDPVGTAPPTVATVHVRLENGDEFQATADTGRPAEDLARQGRRLDAKFRALAGPVVGSERAAGIAGMVEGLDELASVRELMALCRPE